MKHVKKELTCTVAGCGNESVALVPCVVIPGETDPVAIATATAEPACDEHVDFLWNHYSVFGALVLLNYVAGRDNSERTRIALQQIAAVLSTHDHPDSKTKAGLISASVTDGMVLQVREN
ncbi:hypothetical protein ACX80E_01130 [Arthrobacter sp. TMN-49]